MSRRWSARRGLWGCRKGMLRGVEDALLRGSQIIFFPEGTRSTRDTDTPFQPGTAALLRRRFGKNVPIVSCWVKIPAFFGDRVSLMRYPGEIVVRYLPPVASDLGRRTFSDHVERQIHDVSRDLCTPCVPSELIFLLLFCVDPRQGRESIFPFLRAFFLLLSMALLVHEQCARARLFFRYKLFAISEKYTAAEYKHPWSTIHRGFSF